MTDERDPMDPQTWYGTPDVCGSCIAWKPGEPRPGEEVAAGDCRLRPELHRVPATLKLCSLYKGRGKFVYAPTPSSGSTRRKRSAAARVLRRTDDGKLVEARPAPSTPRPSAPRQPRAPIERPAAPRTVDVGTDDRDMLRHVLRAVLRREFPDSEREMLGKYEGGKVEVYASDGTKVKTIDTERFFAMLENFRVALDGLEDKVVQTDELLPSVPELTAQLRRVQGSFTTFNALYERRADYFSGKA